MDALSVVYGILLGVAGTLVVWGRIDRLKEEQRRRLGRGVGEGLPGRIDRDTGSG